MVKAGLLGLDFDGLAKLCGGGFGVTFVFPYWHVDLMKVVVEASWRAQEPFASAKPDPVETVENTRDK
jgi:hypothetical protein